ncbi:MAG TPA: hypothetical protein PKA62_10630 [Thermoanaerobaculia bacterium]|nr:hypothetical protein [Thermoanaerobaculia bacterium]
MSISRNISRAALGALTAGAVITLVAPLLSYERAAQAGGREEETTITIATSKDKEATVLKLDPMKPGETKTLTSESGKPVLVTRTEDGYTLKIGEKELTVKAFPGGEGPHVLLPGGKEVHVVKAGEGDGPTMVFTGDDEKKVVVKKHAFAYTIGEGADTPRAADVLEKAAPKSLEGLDPRTRGAVEQVLQELIESGAVLAPGVLPTSWIAKDDGDGEKVRVMVIRKKDEGAKK